MSIVDDLNSLCVSQAVVFLFLVWCGSLSVEEEQKSNHHLSVVEFRTGKAPIMVATDVAARGLGKLSYNVCIFH